MRPFVFSLVMMLAVQQGCNPGKGNEGARSQAEREIRPYFPAVRAIVEESRKTLVVYTCANVGKAGVDTSF
jgi:hypothetical protein